MRHRTLVPLTVLLAATACSSPDARDDAPDAAPTSDPTVVVERTTDLADPEGSVLGTAWLRDADGGIEIELDVSGLPAGLQDVGLYRADSCEAVVPDEPVVGLPALSVLEDGTGALTTVVGDTSPEEILQNGRTVVITAAGAEDGGPGLPGSWLACGTFPG